MKNLNPLKKNNVNLAGKVDAGRSIVFVHGFGTDQTVWKDVAAAYMNDFRVILLDNAGAGNSEPEAFQSHHYLNLHPYASDLLDVCNALDLRDAILVGHSVGAMIGVLAAIRQPEHFSRLVLIGASPRYLEDEGYCGGFTKADLDSLYSTMFGSYNEWADTFSPILMGNPDKPNLISAFAKSIKSIPAERALAVLCSIFQSDHRADIGKLEKPTLLIQAQEDFAVPLAVAEFLQHQIKGSCLSVINATGHLPHVSAPSEVLAAMRDFLSE